MSDRLTPEREAGLRLVAENDHPRFAIPMLLAEIDALRAERDRLADQLAKRNADFHDCMNDLDRALDQRDALQRKLAAALPGGTE